MQNLRHVASPAAKALRNSGPGIATRSESGISWGAIVTTAATLLGAAGAMGGPKCVLHSKLNFNTSLPAHEPVKQAQSRCLLK